MKKKSALIPVIMVVIAILFWLLPIRLPIFSIHPHQAIPRHAGVFFSIKKADLDSLQKAKTKNELLDLFIPDEITEDIAHFNSLIGNQLKILPKTEFFVTVNSTKSLGTDLMFILPKQGGLNLEKYLSLHSDWQLRKFIFNNRKVYTLRKDELEFSFTKFRNLLVFARHAYLVENAISQLKMPKQSLCKNPDFKKINKRKKDIPNSIPFFINLENLPSQFAPLIEPSKSSEIKAIKSALVWTRLNIPIEKEESVWTGAIFPNRENELLRANQLADLSSKNQYLQFLPDNLTGYFHLRIKDLDKNNWPFDQTDWVGEEVIFAIGESSDKNTTEQFLLLKSNDNLSAEKELEAISIHKDTESVSFQMFKVFHVQSPPIFSFSRDQSEQVFAASLGDYVVFANTQAGIERWLGKYLAGQTCSNHVPLLRMNALLDHEFHSYIYANGMKAWQHLSPFLSADYLQAVYRNPLPFEKLAATIIWEKGVGEITFTSLANPLQEKLPANILWSVPLAREVHSKPYVFTNPKTGEKDIIVTDQTNHIYLISRSGRLLWKKELPEPIKSEIFHIDFHNKGEGQFAFSTKSAIYIIDRQGAFLDGFPLKLQVPATNGVAVVDFFQSHDYNFFIACENGKAYGFDEKGSPIEGWRPNEKIGRVEHPILHFQADGKDFLVLLDILGNLQVYKKNGSPRFKKIEFEEPLMQMPDYQISKKSSRIVAATNEGIVYVCNLSGNHFRLKLRNDNNNVQFLFADVVGDERKDYMALSGNKLTVHRYEGNKFGEVLNYNFPAEQDDIFPVHLIRSRKAYIGALNLRKKQITLLDGNGNMPDQFPLEGTTPFIITDLTDDGKLVLVTGNGSRVTAYALK